MLGFSPLASTPLGDDGFVESGGVSLSANSIVTGSPVLASSAITQAQVLSAANITTDPAVVSDTSLGQAGSFSPVSIVTDTPSLGTTDISVISNLSAGSIVTDAPVVGTSTAFSGNLIVNSIVTGPAIVGTSVIIQEQSFSVVVIVTGSPSLGTPVVNGSSRRVVNAAGNPSNAVLAVSSKNVTSVTSSSSKVA